jgi:serine protease Do
MFRTLAFSIVFASAAVAADPVNKQALDTNTKMVKIFGSGGFRGATNYSTGMLVSSEGHILTIASTTLDTSELIVHLYDGRRMKATVMVVEPELDAALLKIKIDGLKPTDPTNLDLPFFDIPAAARRPAAEPGDWVLAYSNQFEIAMRNEPVSVQRGSIMSYSKLHGRRGIFDFPYTGDVYVVDAIMCNPGSGGGALTDRKGNLLGVIGREIKNSLSETWINYAIPLQAKVDIKDGDKTVTVSLPDFVAKGIKGEYKPVQKVNVASGPGGYHGMKFVPNVLERTPPYVDEIIPNSPAAKAGVMVNDLVSFIDGEPIYSIKSFQDSMKRTRSDTVIRLEVRRGDNLQTIELKLEEWPKDQIPPAAPKPSPETEPKK